MEIDDTLPQMAIEASRNAYVPYSGFKVGAAVITEDGSIYTGCNIENGSYGLTMCAERTAIYKAISGGARKIKAIAIAGGENTPAYPCGACRQVLSEFGNADTTVCCLTLDGKKRETFTLEELLPKSFNLNASTQPAN